MLGESTLGLIRDVEVPFLVGGIVDNTEVILGDKDGGIVAASGEAALPLLVAYGIVDDVVLVHAAPREIVVEGELPAPVPTAGAGFVVMSTLTSPFGSVAFFSRVRAVDCAL